MDYEKALSIIHQLRTKEIAEQLILKDEFMAFREVLIKEKDKMHFIGKAEKGGNVVFYYQIE